jgi:hypothetical protein
VSAGACARRSGRGANLSQADLRGANLSDAILEDTVLSGAQADTSTIWPTDFNAQKKNALFHLLTAETSCYRYWGEGIWTDYGAELARRTGQLIRVHDGRPSGAASLHTRGGEPRP